MNKERVQQILRGILERHEVKRKRYTAQQISIIAHDIETMLQLMVQTLAIVKFIRADLVRKGVSREIEDDIHTLLDIFEEFILGMQGVFMRYYGIMNETLLIYMVQETNGKKPQ